MAKSKQVRQALIREVQTHPVRRRFLHVDFYEVPLDQLILVDVPVEIDGESIGEKKGGCAGPHPPHAFGPVPSWGNPGKSPH